MEVSELARREWPSDGLASRTPPVLMVEPVAPSIEDLVGGGRREPMRRTTDGLSGATFERVTIGGDRFVLKHLHVDGDWVARSTGDLRCRPLLAWSSGLLTALPACLDHAIVGVAGGLGRDGLGAAVLMRDVGPELVAQGDGLLSLEIHERFIAHMARLHATFWGWSDGIGLQPLANRIYELTPFTTQVEAARGGTEFVPPMIAPGWQRLRIEAPRAGPVAWELLGDPSPLLQPLSRGPQTLIHGDMKLGNMGSTSGGRTILLDWAVPGEAPALLDLVWYLAVNCDRLPESKEAVIERYRAELTRAGVSTDGWWSTQLGLALIVGFVQMGWCKRGDELAWWEDRVIEAADLLD